MTLIQIKFFKEWLESKINVLLLFKKLKLRKKINLLSYKVWIILKYFKSKYKFFKKQIHLRVNKSNESKQ